MGCLILDEFYEPKLEGYDVTSYYVLEAVRQSLGKEPNEWLLADLQCVHDSWAVKDWRNALLVVADKYDLVYTDYNPVTEIA